MTSPQAPRGDVELSAIVACSKNRVIGRENKLPWHIPEDLKFFRDKTAGHIMIMGRKTFESLPKPLPKRFHIVITRQKDYSVDHPMVRVVPSLEAAIDLAKTMTSDYPTEIFVVGGGEIYKQSLPVLDRVYLTSIDAQIEGDAYFPELPQGEWKLLSERKVKGDPSYSFEIWIPIQPRQSVR